MKVRADALLVERGLCESRSKAQALILAGAVYSGERRIEKPGSTLAADAPLSVRAGPRFVSRGGDKLAHAIEVFRMHGLDIAGKACADIGASTGGFTDCLLQHGARRVHAVDVGWGQLHARLRSDARVVVRERTNAKNLTPEDFDALDLVVVDASFIGIGKLIDVIARLLSSGGELVALIKPQFEAGRAQAARGRGVIRDPEVRRDAIARALDDIERAGFSIVATVDSAVAGPKGNVEHFVYAKRAHCSKQ